ncbi:MAG: heme exporter protein CcmD [Betaproteobacteria bacterium]
MNWGSLDSFLAMGGYGFYVWGSYALSAIVLIAEITVLRRRHRTLRRGASPSAQQPDSNP